MRGGSEFVQRILRSSPMRAGALPGWESKFVECCSCTGRGRPAPECGVSSLEAIRGRTRCSGRSADIGQMRLGALALAMAHGARTPAVPRALAV